MNYVKVIIIFLIFFYFIKILNILINKKISELDKKIQQSKIENGLLSVKDLKKENYNRFLNTVNHYLKMNKYNKITILDGGNPSLTNMKALINNEEVFISCIQSDKLDPSSTSDEHLKPTSRNEIQCFLGRMTLNNCLKGLIINNSTFSKEAVKYIDSLNSSNKNIQITLVNGYALTKAIRKANT